MTDKPSDEWYFRLENQIIGPLKPDEIATKFLSGEFDFDTPCRKDGFADWVAVKDTSLIKNYKNLKLWFYLQGDNSIGPITDIEVQSRIESGNFSRDTLLWSYGKGWRRASNTSFAVPAQNNKQKIPETITFNLRSIVTILLHFGVPFYIMGITLNLWRATTRIYSIDLINLNNFGINFGGPIALLGIIAMITVRNLGDVKHNFLFSRLKHSESSIIAMVWFVNTVVVLLIIALF